jgi:hypothetical protein
MSFSVGAPRGPFQTFYYPEMLPGIPGHVEPNVLALAQLAGRGQMTFYSNRVSREAA